jgi:hypothetical protein
MTRYGRGRELRTVSEQTAEEFFFQDSRFLSWPARRSLE